MMLKRLFIILFIIQFQFGHSQIELLSDEFNSRCSLSDWFDINDTEGWDAQHLESHDISQTFPGQLMLMPYTTSWFQDRRGSLLFKLASGDFVFTTEVRVTNRTLDGFPSSEYSLSGVMMREPKTMTDPTQWSPGEEDYIFLSTGFASTNHPTCPGCPGPHFEVKSTNNGNSNLQVSSIDSAHVTIRIARLNDFIIVLYQLGADSFSVHQRYYRPDFPDTVQVGLVAYTDWPKVSTYSTIVQNENVMNADLDPGLSNNRGLPFNPDVIARFDYARFGEIDLPANLENTNLLDESLVPDSVLLSFLAFESVATFSGHTWTGFTSSDFHDPSNWSNGVVPDSTSDVRIPDCSCPEMNTPVISFDTVRINTLEMQPGGDLLISTGSRLEVRIE